MRLHGIDCLASSAVGGNTDGAHSLHAHEACEGRWTLDAAIDEAVPAPVLSAALFAHFSSRGQANFADKLLSALRAQFGGHAERPAPGQEAHDGR